MKYDIEQVLRDIKELLVNKLNTKITAINSEKNDTIVLEDIDDAAYFLQSLDGKQANYNPFVYYGIREILPVSEPNSFSRSSTTLTVDVGIVVADNGHDSNISYRMLRYMRVLKETFEDNFDYLSSSIKIAIESQVPVEISLLNESYGHRVGGVSLKIDMG